MQQEKILRRQEKKKLSGIKVKVCLVYLRKKNQASSVPHMEQTESIRK